MTTPLAKTEDGVELRLVGSAVIGIMMWVVTTSLRSVSWAFSAGLGRNVQVVYVFFNTCGDRFVGAARDAHALALPSSELATSLLTLAFSIPMAVLRD